MRTTGSIINNTTIDDLAERISIVYQKAQRNNRGDILGIEDVARCTVWAKVLPLSARRLLDDSVEAVNEVSYRITIRHRTDIAPDDIVLWRGKRLQQTAPPYDAESRRIWTVLECVEMKADESTQSG